MKFAKWFLILWTIDSRFWWIIFQAFRFCSVDWNKSWQNEGGYVCFRRVSHFALLAECFNFPRPFFDSYSLWSWGKILRYWYYFHEEMNVGRSSAWRQKSGADYSSQLPSTIWFYTYLSGDLQVFNAGPCDGSDDCSDECCPQADNDNYIVYFLSQRRLCAPVTRRSTLACFLVED